MLFGLLQLFVAGLFLSLFKPVSSLFNEYVHSKSLANGQYNLQWKIEREHFYLSIDVHDVDAESWIGFGIGETTSGSMAGADIVTVELIPEGELQENNNINIDAVITDRHAFGFFKPEADMCQDWILLEASYDSGTAHIEIFRQIDTGDQQDRALEIPINRIIYAWGNGPFDYHQNNRGLLQMNWVDAPDMILNPGEEENLGGFQIEMTDAPISSDHETTYMCESFKIPTEIPTSHVISIEAVINPQTSPYVHHFILQACKVSGDTLRQLEGNPTNCWSVHESDRNCSMIWGWAPGVDALNFPPEAGVKIGQDGYTWFHLQMHYHNPQHIPNLKDGSGVKFLTTTQLRKYDAGTLILGDVSTSGAPMAPGQSSIHYEYDCPEECTQDWPHAIHLMGDILHSHAVGKRMYSTLWRDGIVSELNRIDFWSFDLQQVTPKNIVLRPGDRINTHCIYDTTSRSEVTQFGPGSNDEMCLEFLLYYPVLPDNWAVCGSSFFQGNNYTICGNEVLWKDQDNNIPYYNPVHPDPPGIVPDYRFGQSPEDGCAALERDPEVIDVNKAPYSALNGIYFLLLLTVLALNLL